jgi:hypothetical protein
MLAIVFGLGTALCYGSADFIGGIAGRRIGALKTVLYAYVLGLPVLVSAALLNGGLGKELVDWLWCGAAGILALAAVWLISRGSKTGTSPDVQRKDLALPLLAGLGMGLYYVFINFGSQNSVLAPLAASRLTGTMTLFFVALGQRKLKPPRAGRLAAGRHERRARSGRQPFLYTGRADRPHGPGRHTRFIVFRRHCPSGLVVAA